MVSALRLAASACVLCSLVLSVSSSVGEERGGGAPSTLLTSPAIDDADGVIKRDAHVYDPPLEGIGSDHKAYEIRCRPRHIHLGVGRTQSAAESSMIVSFSFLPECSRHYGEAVVGAIRVGDGQHPMRLVIGDIDDVQSYNASLTEKQLKFATDGQTHYFSDDYYHIEIDGLKPGTRYYYECLLVYLDHLPRQSLRRDQSFYRQRNNYQIFSQSSQSTFLTPPAPGEWYPPPMDRTIKFAVLGDLATRRHSRETVKNLEQGNLSVEDAATPEEAFHRHHGQGIDCILLAGDLSYANGDHTIWDDWMDMMSEHGFFRTIPLQIAVGNHDLDHMNTLEIALAYEKRFRMPQIRPAERDLAQDDLFHPNSLGSFHFQPIDYVPYEYGNAYYTFTFGPSKHFVLSSYSDFGPGSVQYEWFLSELNKVDRSVTPWLIVMIHCPPYTTFKIHHNEIFIRQARKYLEPVFVEHNVNFVISGHIHSYMRTVPQINAMPDPKGPVYIIQGNGGRQANEPYINATVPEDWVSVRDHSQYGYGTLELFNVTHARWKWVKTGINDEGGARGGDAFIPEYDLHDEAWIENQLFVE